MPASEPGARRDDAAVRASGPGGLPEGAWTAARRSNSSLSLAGLATPVLAQAAAPAGLGGACGRRGLGARRRVVCRLQVQLQLRTAGVGRCAR
eukprot:5965795-Alexandrium_andersonii.AAC.1